MSSGYASKAGINLGATWGSFSAADTLLPFVSETLTVKYDELQSDALIGRAAEDEIGQGIEKVTGDLVCNLTTKGPVIDLIAYGMGARTTNNIDFANDLSANLFDLEIEKGIERYRFYSCMIDKVTIAGAAGETAPIKVTFGVVAYRCLTSATAFPTLSLGATEKTFLYFGGPNSADAVKFRIGDLTDALAAGDDTGIKSFELSLENNLQLDGTDTESDGYVLLPERNDFRRLALKLGLARYNASTVNFVSWKEAATRLQATLALVGSDAASITFNIPLLKISGGADFNVGGPGVIEGAVDLKAFYNDGTINAAMSTITDQMEIVTTAY